MAAVALHPSTLAKLDQTQKDAPSDLALLLIQTRQGVVGPAAQDGLQAAMSIATQRVIIGQGQQPLPQIAIPERDQRILQQGQRAALPAARQCR